jgi:hypothetical protein
MDETGFSIGGYAAFVAAVTLSTMAHEPDKSIYQGSGGSGDKGAIGTSHGQRASIRS